MSKYVDRKCGTCFMSAENMPENMSIDLPDILCRNNPASFYRIQSPDLSSLYTIIFLPFDKSKEELQIITISIFN